MSRGRIANLIMQTEKRRELNPWAGNVQIHEV